MFALILAEALAGPPPCDPLTTADLNEHLTKAEVAFLERDKAAVSVWTNEATDSLRCLHQAVAPVDVARLYILKGLQTFLESRRSETQQWFEAARNVAPDQDLPDSSLHADHPIRVLFDGVNTATPGTRRLPRPAGGWLVVDGRPATEAPLGRTWMLQRADPSGTIVETRLIGAADPLPAYPRTRSPHVGLLAGAWHYPNPGGPTVMGVAQLQLSLPVAGVLDADLALALGTFRSGVLPAIRAGGRVWLTSGGLSPYVAGVVELTGHADGGLQDDAIEAVVRPAVGLPVGIRWSREKLAVDVELSNTLGRAQDGDKSRVATRLVAGVSFPL